PAVVVRVAGAVAAAAIMPLFVEMNFRGIGHVLYEVLVELAIAAPFALRMLPVVVTQVTVTLALFGAAGAVLEGRGWWIARAGGEGRPPVDVAPVPVPSVALLP